MEQEKKLQYFLIKKFIIILVVVSVVDYGILWFINRKVMPLVLQEFFPGYEKAELINGGTVVLFVILGHDNSEPDQSTCFMAFGSAAGKKQ